MKLSPYLKYTNIFDQPKRYVIAKIRLLQEAKRELISNGLCLREQKDKKLFKDNLRDKILAKGFSLLEARYMAKNTVELYCNQEDKEGFIIGEVLSKMSDEFVDFIETTLICVIEENKKGVSYFDEDGEAIGTSEYYTRRKLEETNIYAKITKELLNNGFSESLSSHIAEQVYWTLFWLIINEECRDVK